MPMPSMGMGALGGMYGGMRRQRRPAPSFGVDQMPGMDPMSMDAGYGRMQMGDQGSGMGGFNGGQPGGDFMSDPLFSSAMRPKPLRMDLAGSAPPGGFSFFPQPAQETNQPFLPASTRAFMPEGRRGGLMGMYA